jgi:rsbT co-antagonist protein RsbR
MSKTRETKEQLVNELAEARARIAELEASEAERRRIEQALRESEEKFSKVFSSSGNAICIISLAENKLVEINESFTRFTGYTREEVIGRSGVELGLWVKKEELERWINTLREKGKVYNEEFHSRMKSGEIRVGLASAETLNIGGEPCRITVIADITERKQAEEALQKAYEEMEERIEERTADLQREIAERERLQQEVIETQRRALRELSTPIIPVMDRIIIMPLIGSIDTLRAKDIMRALLAGIREHRAKVVILDITGVPIVDSGVANHLNKTIQAARLKGAQTIVTGIADAVAEAIVDLGIDWSGIETLADLQTGLRVALDKMGLRTEE